MRRKKHFIRPIIEHEHGVTLVEVLLAVTIMSIISVTLMGYFVSSIEKSADQSRRVIAANLARLKAAEFREAYKNAAAFEQLNHDLSNAAGHKLMTASPPSGDINGTVFRYLITFEDAGALGGTDLTSQLVRMNVTVYWSEQETANPPARRSVSFDSYVRKKGAT